ncbi:hypothetical protein EPN95_04205 [Patescibacteria group bacterium]|nr:MAG: hypothetical protein EPN95_04205 [Patescibacteria group bacterium]
MKIYLSHSTNYDYEKDLYGPLKTSSMGREHQILFPHDTENSSANSKDPILHGDLVIAEVSYPSTGQGIELGWANDGDMPILCIYKKNAKISSALRFITNELIEYENEEDMLNKLTTWLSAKN